MSDLASFKSVLLTNMAANMNPQVQEDRAAERKLVDTGISQLEQATVRVKTENIGHKANEVVRINDLLVDDERTLHAAAENALAALLTELSSTAS